MAHESISTDPPLRTLKEVADDVWIVDGPVIEFGAAFLKMPFPTRMTLIRLGSGDLLLHSPTELTPRLAEQVRGIGHPRWIVAPNRLHYWWVADWHRTFPDAEIYLAPGVRERARDRIDFDCRALAANDGYPWDRDVATLLIAGGYMTEAAFFHRASRTLVLTDLIENFEPDKVPTRFLRWLTRWAGVQHPHGGMPIDMRMTFARRKPLLRDAIQQMIEWDPERIIVAHGRCYGQDGKAELRRAFGWVLDAR